MQLLKNIKVVELSHMVMGPSAGLILADLGADVIKIEPIGGDKTRRLPGSGAGYFAMFNRNKRSLCLDMKSEAGAAILRELLGDADVMLENFRPGALDKLGFGYEAVKALNPQIIYQSSKGFLSGPYEDRTALDEVAQMMGGLAYMTGPPGRPLRAGASVIDITGGMFGVIGILSALVRRAGEDGGGAHVTSALFETTTFLCGQHIAQHAVTGKAAPPMPARVSAWAVYDVFDVSDGQVFVGVVSDGQWQAFCEHFDLRDWLTPEYATNIDRVAQRDEIMPRLRALFGAMTRDALMEALGAAGLPYAPINRPEDLAEDPHVSATGLHDLRLPGQEKAVRLPKLPLEIDSARGEVTRDLPRPGENTDDVLRALGRSEDEIAQLRAEGVVA